MSAMANIGYTDTDSYYLGVRTINLRVVCVYVFKLVLRFTAGLLRRK